MKKSGMLGVLAAGAAVVGVYVGGALWAQPGGAPPAARPTGGTRVAVINMGEIFKKYSKCQGVRDEMTAKAKDYDEVLKKKATRLDTYMKDIKEARDPQKKEALEAEARSVKLEYDNERAKFQKQLLQLQDERLTALFFEIQKAVKEYAAKNQIDLVFRFNEDWDPEATETKKAWQNYYKPENVVKRLNHPFWPIHWEPSLDIPHAVLGMLQQNVAAAPGVVPGGAAPKN